MGEPLDVLRDWSRAHPGRSSTCRTPTPNRRSKRKFDRPQFSRSAGSSLIRRPATTAPHTLKIPPIKITARSTIESCVGNSNGANCPPLAPIRPPATPVMKAASPNAQSLYRVMLTPAASAAGSLSRIAAHARPGFRHLPQREQEHDRRDNHRVAEVRSVARCDPWRRMLGPPPNCTTPRKPPPPFGKWRMLTRSVIAPANMSVISARWSPEMRNAGNPTRSPISP